MPRSGTLLLFALAAVPYVIVAAAGRQAKPTYAADVLPVLKAHCASCHSGASASAGLDLTTVDGLKRVVKAGDSKNSLIIQRLKGIGGDQMPMGFAPLPDDTINRIATWIDAGASIDKAPAKHWAYVGPIRPINPVTKDKKWAKNAIDSFVLARLEKEGLRPSPPAAKEKLVRRVYLDLIGLPPSPKEIDAFLADKRPDAYERVVDTLLKNPHYGERMAEPWLDYSRYADTDGYEKDLRRAAWKYRDWLISAFNRNLPYDQFVVEQLAGDLLPNPAQDQLVATGFNRNSMFNREGGVDQEEAHFNVILDRVNTTSTVFLGSTLGCARCHDHKYDPFTQRDYYRMSAFFSDAQIYPRGPKEVGEEKWEEAQIEVPTRQQETERARLKGEIAALHKNLGADTPELQQAYRQWRAAVGQAIPWKTIHVDAATSANGATLNIGPDGVVSSMGKLPDTDSYSLTFILDEPAEGIRIEALPDDSLPSHGPGRADNGNFVLTKVFATYRLQRVTLATRNVQHAVADYDQRDFGSGRLLGKDVNFGWAVDGAVGQTHEIILDMALPAKTPITLHLEQRWPGGKHLLGKFRLSATTLDSPATVYLPVALRGADDAKLQTYFRQVTPLLDADRAKLAADEMALGKLQSEIPTALVMRDKPHPGPLTAFIHSRGEFLSPTELVTAGVPGALGGIPPMNSSTSTYALHRRDADATSDRDAAPVPHLNDNSHAPAGPALTRLDLARWIVSKKNPLAARVEVNRLWEQCFGRGIVETSEDFGTQGARPSHPELLDWLACELMDSGWNIKHVMRLIVTSATYRQDSRATRALIARDPQNVLLARGPRFRLDAETIRDQALAASGLLKTTIGGPSVYPYQPDGVWDNPFSNERWPESNNGDQYRRGLYTFLKRTAPYPSALSFDGTSREECVIRRIRTDTPLQALAMLNDRAVFDAAKALGRIMMADSAPLPVDDRATVSLRTKKALIDGFRRCTCRKPSAQELQYLQQLIARIKAHLSAESILKLGGSREAATWTMVANVLLNLDETLTKD